MEREIITSARAYRSRSHLSHAVRWGNVVWTAGLGPLTLDRTIVSSSIGDQARQCLENLRAVLEEAGTDLEHLIKVTVYLRHMEDFPEFERVYQSFIQGTPPARCTVACGLGHPATDGKPGMDIEIEAVAGVP